MQQRIDRRTVVKGAGILAGVAAAGLVPAVVTAAQASPEPEEASLYDRVGGIYAIAAVVDRFSDQILVNPKLNENPALKAWNETQAETRLPGLKFGRTLWIAALAGGPFDYTMMPLDEAHTEFDLTPEEFAEVASEIVSALEYFGVPEKEIQELAAAYSTAMGDVVSE